MISDGDNRSVTTNIALLARNEYLAAENRVLKAQLKGTCSSRTRTETLGEIKHRLGREALAEVATVARSGSIDLDPIHEDLWPTPN